jgi:hypothetical protein
LRPVDDRGGDRPLTLVPVVGVVEAFPDATTGTEATGAESQSLITLNQVETWNCEYVVALRYGVAFGARRARKRLQLLPRSWSQRPISLDRPLVGNRSPAGFGDRHPDNGNPPRAGTYRSRLNRGQTIARELVKQ